MLVSSGPESGLIRYNRLKIGNSRAGGPLTYLVTGYQPGPSKNRGVADFVFTARFVFQAAGVSRPATYYASPHDYSGSEGR